MRDEVDGKVWRGVKTWEIYEWALELLRDCRGLKRLGVGISGETKKGMEKETGPVKGLEGLKGMGLTSVEVRVRQVHVWGPQ